MKKVSVFLMTYNHENFIAQAIESMVAQKTNFDFEVVIGEDFSKDNTRAICERYASQYPDIIRLLPSDKNYGMMGNTIRILQACTAKYIALCEGDDYWIDDYKLQKQADFLDANPDYTLCFSDVEVKDEMDWNLPNERYWPKPEKDTFTIEDIILSEMSLAPTPTMMFRNDLPDPIPDFYMNALSGDIGTQLFVTHKGKAKYLPGKTAVYRNHATGLTKSKKNIEKGNEALMQLYAGFNKFSDYRYDSVFRQRFLANAKTQLIYGSRNKKGMEKIRHYFKIMPDYIKYSDKINFKELAYYHAILFFPFLLKPFKKS